MENQNECPYEAMAKELYSMKCLEFKKIEQNPGSNWGHVHYVQRVPGGWLFYDIKDNRVFVPFNNEFQPK